MRDTKTVTETQRKAVVERVTKGQELWYVLHELVDIIYATTATERLGLCKPILLDEFPEMYPPNAEKLENIVLRVVAFMCERDAAERTRQKTMDGTRISRAPVREADVPSGPDHSAGGTSLTTREAWNREDSAMPYPSELDNNGT